MIKEDVKEITNKILTVKEKLQKSVWTELTDEGYLTSEIKEYLACFTGIDRMKLDGLLDGDLQHWRN